MQRKSTNLDAAVFVFLYAMSVQTHARITRDDAIWAKIATMVPEEINESATRNGYCQAKSVFLAK